MMYHRTLLLMVFLACEVNAESFLINRSDVTQDDQGFPARHVSKRPVEAVGTSENFLSESRALALVTRGLEATSPTLTRTESNISNKRQRRSWGLPVLDKLRRLTSYRRPRPRETPNPKAQKKQKHGCCYRCCCCCCYRCCCCCCHRHQEQKKKQQRANQPYNQQTPRGPNGSPYPPHGYPPNDPKNRNTDYPRYHDTPHRRPPNDPRNGNADYRRYLERFSPPRRLAHDGYELRRSGQMAKVAKMMNRKPDGRHPHGKHDARQPHRKHEGSKGGSDDDNNVIYPASDVSDVGDMNIPDPDGLSLLGPNFDLPHVSDFVGNVADFGRYRPTVSVTDPECGDCCDEQCCSCCLEGVVRCFGFLGNLYGCIFKYGCCCGCPNECGPIGVGCKCLGYVFLKGSPPAFE